MEIIVLTIHILTAIALIGFILIQQGKGAEVGASFGSGASQTVFGSQGSGSFLTRITAILVTVFFLTSLTLGYLASHRGRGKNIDELMNKMSEQQVPATDGKTTAPTIHKNRHEGDIPKVPTSED